MDDKNGTMPKATPCPPKTLKTGADETKMENVPDVQTADVIKKEDRNDRNMSASSPPKMLKTMADEIKMNNVPDAQMALPIKVEDSSDRNILAPSPPKKLKIMADEAKMNNVPGTQIAVRIKVEDSSDRNISGPSPPKKLKTMADEAKMNNVPDTQMAVQIKVEDSSDRSGRYPTPPPPLELQDLPDEVLLKVFMELGLQDLTSCAHSCRRWQDLIWGRQRLWRGKKYTAFRPSQYKQALKMMQLMPKLEMVRFVNSWRPAIHLTYPEAVLVFSNGVFEASFPDCTFNAENVIVCSSVADNSDLNFLTWLNVKSLKNIQIADQCESPFVHWRAIFNLPADRRFCDMTECALHMVQMSLHNHPVECCTVPPRGPAGTKWLFPSLQQLCITADIVNQKVVEDILLLCPIRVLCLKFCPPPMHQFLSRWKTPLEVLLFE